MLYKSTEGLACCRARKNVQKILPQPRPIVTCSKILKKAAKWYSWEHSACPEFRSKPKAVQVFCKNVMLLFMYKFNPYHRDNENVKWRANRAKPLKLHHHKYLKYLQSINTNQLIVHVRFVGVTPVFLEVISPKQKVVQDKEKQMKTWSRKSEWQSVFHAVFGGVP